MNCTLYALYHYFKLKNVEKSRTENKFISSGKRVRVQILNTLKFGSAIALNSGFYLIINSDGGKFFLIEYCLTAHNLCFVFVAFVEKSVENEFLCCQQNKDMIYLNKIMIQSYIRGESFNG